MVYVSDREKTVIEHVRRPRLPWRAEEYTRTECGLLLTAAGRVLSREDFIEKVKRLGQQRAAMTTCMTCFNTAQSHPTWETNPVACLGREVEHWRQKNEIFRRELRALAALVARHPEEFAELMKDQEEIVPLASVKPKKGTPARSKW